MVFIPERNLFEALDPEVIFDKTIDFQKPPVNKSKISLTASGEGVLRMISHALSLQEYSYPVSYVGESADCDPQITYFMDNSQKNSLLINFLAEQGHLKARQNPSALDIRLGAIRRDPQAARCYLVDSVYVFFNLNAIKWSDAPAQSGHNPSGLTSEEANQLAYMCGQSHKNKFFILYGFDHPDRDPHGLSINCAVQMLWYYQYGAGEKSQAWPVPEGQSQDFTIESAMTSHNLLFRKDRLTGNWFHRIPWDLQEELSPHQWIASSHEEYLAAAQDDLPVRLLEWYERLGQE